MKARFSFIHISDMHLCIESNRLSALSLMERNARGAIDTLGEIRTKFRAAGRQIKDHGLVSISKPTSYVPAIISGVAQFCLKYSRNVDGIIVSGDLATTGIPVDLHVALKYVDDPADDGFLSKAGKPTINSNNRRIYVIPGNHDRYANNYAVTNSRTFDIIFENYLKKQNIKGSVGHWVREKNGSLIAFVTADFSLKTHKDASSRIHAYGQGMVYDEVLDALVKRTFELKRKYQNVAIVWLIHFAPFDCGSRFLQLRGWERIPQAAAAAGVVATLCGHTHEKRMQVMSDHLILCAGSAGCVDSERRSAVHIVHFDLAESVEITRENFVWDSTLKEFKWFNDDRRDRLNPI